jgi:VWFA-related protein
VIRGALLAALMAVTCVSAQQAPPARFRSSADAVRVDVQVRNGSKPVAGLTAADFELRDTNVVQEIQAISIEDVPISLMLALDVSTSVHGKLLEQLKAAARAAVGALRKDDQAALLTFSQRVGRAAAFTADREALTQAIDVMQANGATALRDAIFTATALRERAAGRVVLLVFTDGMDTASWLDSQAVTNSALRSDIVVYGVSSAGRMMMDYEKSWYEAEPELFPALFLSDVAERSGGERIVVKNGTELAPTFARIVSDFKSRYLLTYSPKDVPAGGWHPLDVKLKRGKGTITARRGYYR